MSEENCKIKIFFIGYNNTGTTSLANFFTRNNMNNELDKSFTGEYPKTFFNKYKTNLSKEEWDKRRYKVYSTCNIIHINEPTSNIINELLINFPLAIFILNDRKLEKWISTRIKACLRMEVEEKNLNKIYFLQKIYPAKNGMLMTKIYYDKYLNNVKELPFT